MRGYLHNPRPLHSICIGHKGASLETNHQSMDTPCSHSRAMAMILQYLSGKSGITTGQSLPEIIREKLKKKIFMMSYWLAAEAALAATDLAEYLKGVSLQIDDSDNMSTPKGRTSVTLYIAVQTVLSLTTSHG
jgi:Natural resistance-associated macrophage protein